MNAKCVSQFQTAIESHQTIELYLCGSKDCLICCYYFVVAFVCTAAAVIVVAVVVFKHEKKMQNSRFIIHIRRFQLAPRGHTIRLFFPYP